MISSVPGRGAQSAPRTWAHARPMPGAQSQHLCRFDDRICAAAGSGSLFELAAERGMKFRDYGPQRVHWKADDAYVNCCRPNLLDNLVRIAGCRQYADIRETPPDVFEDPFCIAQERFTGSRQ